MIKRKEKREKIKLEVKEAIIASEKKRSCFLDTFNSVMDVMDKNISKETKMAILLELTEEWGREEIKKMQKKWEERYEKK